MSNSDRVLVDNWLPLVDGDWAVAILERPDRYENRVFSQYPTGEGQYVFFTRGKPLWTYDDREWSDFLSKLEEKVEDAGYSAGHVSEDLDSLRRMRALKETLNEM